VGPVPRGRSGCVRPGDLGGAEPLSLARMRVSGVVRIGYVRPSASSLDEPPFALLPFETDGPRDSPIRVGG
jgi:hypothetical protein